MIYYKHNIVFNEETKMYEYNLCGWEYSVTSLEEAKTDIKQNWRQSLYFHNHCC